MRICFFGSSLVSSYWNGAATYYRGLLKALARLGHDVTFFEPDAFERQRHRDIPDPDWARVVVYPASDEGWRRTLELASSRADLLIKASGVGVFDRELEIAVPQACRPGCLSVFWDVDAPATLDRIASDPRDHMRAAVVDYDLILTYGGGQPVVSAYLELGARLCRPIYNAVDLETHFPVPARSSFETDLGFLGNRLPDREARVGEFFLEPARRLPQRRFLLGGAGWNQNELPPNVHALGHVGTKHHNAFFASGFATLNVTRDSMARYGFSPATRVFEAAGVGACLITDAWEGVELFFEPDQEVLVADGAEAVVEVLNRITPPEAKAIGEAALRRARSEHTYTHRAIQVEDLIDAATIRTEAAE